LKGFEPTNDSKLAEVETKTTVHEQAVRPSSDITPPYEVAIPQSTIPNQSQTFVHYQIIQMSEYHSTVRNDGPTVVPLAMPYSLDFSVPNTAPTVLLLGVPPEDTVGDFEYAARTIADSIYSKLTGMSLVEAVAASCAARDVTKVEGSKATVKIRLD